MPFQASCCPAGDARDVDIEQLADRGAAEVRGADPGSPDVGAVTGQHPVLAGGICGALGLPRHLDRDGLARKVQELEQAPPDRGYLIAIAAGGQAIPR